MSNDTCTRSMPALIRRIMPGKGSLGREIDRHILYMVALTGEEIDVLVECINAYAAEGWWNELSAAVSEKLDAARKKGLSH